MKFGLKDIILVSLVLVVLYLLIPRISFAGPVSAPAPAPAPALSNCSPAKFRMADVCPTNFPYTGTLSADGTKTCCTR